MGDSGLLVSRLSLGGMTFTLGSKRVAAVSKVGEPLARQMIDTALDCGVNFIDTADAYSDSESEIILGRALKGRRDDVVISTKYGFRYGPTLTQAGLSRRHTMWAVDECLKRLDTDWIDVFIAHKVDFTTPVEETLVALDDVVKSGKVRYVGFSNWPAWQVAAALEFQKANGLARFITGQMYYSLVCRDVENDIIPLMRHYGVGMMVWSPLAQGFLSGKYTPDNLDDEDDRLSGFDVLPLDKVKGFKAVDKLREIAAAKGCSVAQAAIAWLLAKEAATSIVLGASKMSQLEDNLGAVDVELAADEVAALDAMMPPPSVYPNWFTDMTTDAAHAEAVGR
jgi:aryl-alcohol dehydrogenase-like predicted oxidoreductase